VASGFSRKKRQRPGDTTARGIAPAPRRVLMTADAVGGVWAYALQLAEGLAPHGVSVTLATMGPRPTADERAAARAIPGLQLVESDYRLEWADDPWNDVARAGAWLLELEARTAPDLVHLNGYAHGSLPWAAPVFVVAHSCVCSWWTAVRGGVAPARWDEYRRAVRAGLHGAAAIAAPSRAMLRALESQYGAVGGHVVPNGRDPLRFAAGPKAPLVLTAGRLWDDAKNVGALVEVAGRLSWPVALAGETGADGAGTAPADTVRFLGRLPSSDLAAWMACASIYVMPARYEPFGLSILEAALSGCALVLGDIASLREIWDGAAVFVRPDDRDALAREIQTLIGRSRRREELARRARARACELTVERMVEGYLRLYGAVLAPAPHAREELSPCAW
jgi:glycogen synthase